MKTTSLILGTAMLFAIGSIATTGYGNSEQKTKEETHKHAEGKGETGDHHEHGEHNHAGRHMEHMNDVLQWLKQELGDKYNQPVPPATEEQQVLGKKIFTKTCASCHGESGKGDGSASAAFKQKPADFTDPAHSKYYSDQGRIYIIKKGVKDTPMPGWESALNEKEIQSVYAYIHSLRSSENEEEQEHDGHDH